MSSPLALKTIEIANGQVGQMEKPLGSNWGQPVESYLAAVHVTSPASWCAAFAAWSVQNAAQALGVTPQLKFSASALHFFDLNPFFQFSTLTPDDLPCIGIYDHGQGKGHCVFFDGLDEASGALTSIEGNSNDNGSREGIGVFALNKYRVDDPELLGFLRIQ